MDKIIGWRCGGDMKALLLMASISREVVEQVTEREVY